MPKDIVDIFKNTWRFLLRFAHDLYTLLKFRGREFDERLQVKYPTSIRALIWLGITIGTIGTILFILTFLSDFAISKINLNGPPPTPTPANQFEYN